MGELTTVFVRNCSIKPSIRSGPKFQREHTFKNRILTEHASASNLIFSLSTNLVILDFEVYNGYQTDLIITYLLRSKYYLIFYHYDKL